MLTIQFIRLCFGITPIKVNKSVYLINGVVLKNYSYGKMNSTITPKDGDGFIFTNIVEKYNFNDNNYIVIGKSVIPKTASGLITLSNGKILIVGGRIFKRSGSEDTDGVLEYKAYKHNILPLYKSDFKKAYWWWKDC